MSVCFDAFESLELIRALRMGNANPDLSVASRTIGLPSHWKPGRPDCLNEAQVPDDGEVPSILKRLRDVPGLRGLPEDALTPPIGFIVSRACGRRFSRLKRVSVCGAPLPAGSILEIAPGMHICSPEFALLRIAHILSFVPALQVAFELCGTFVEEGGPLAVEEYDEYGVEPARNAGFVRTAPVSSARRMAALCAGVKGVHGVCAMRSVVPHVLDGAASPREVDLALVLFLPRRRGGYGLPPAELNAVRAVDARTRPLVGVGGGRSGIRMPYVPDFSWPRHALALEYDSDAEHTGRTRILRDALRRNAFEADGVGVLTVTNRQLQSVEETDRIALQLAQKLGVVMRGRDWGNGDWRGKQSDLRAALGLDARRSEFEGWHLVE